MSWKETDMCIADLLAFFNGEMTEDEYCEKWPGTYQNPHGKCIDVIWEAYGDRFIYEDGYDEFISRD